MHSSTRRHLATPLDVEYKSIMLAGYLLTSALELLIWRDFHELEDIRVVALVLEAG